VFLLAWLEYVFPPVPGDSTMLLACFLAGTGALPKVPTYGACLGGSILGAFTAYAAGARLGHSYFFLRSDWAKGELRKFERGLQRFGARLLLLNRFIPGVRAVFLYGAGIGRLPLRQVAIYSTLGNIAWVTLLAWGGTRLGSSWEEVQRVFSRYALGIGAVLAVYFVIGYVLARRRAAIRSG
jgi:membrane protein DedA with SNARE-associated domain